MMAASADVFSLPVHFREEHRLIFTRDVFAPANRVLAEVLAPREPGESVRALVFLDAALEKVAPGLVERIQQWFAQNDVAASLAAPPVVLPGGEGAKNSFAELEHVWSAINHAGLCRHSYIVAVGGGALLDLVGFAASTAHRGIPLVRLPTTSLSQGDGGVGVKNGINYFGKKNWLGAFTIPHAVINDADFLHLLPERERRAGLIEALKVGLIRHAPLFNYIHEHAEALARFDPVPFEHVISLSARQHLDHIATAGDPFERGSARPLDFGHWSAHKLEQMSAFRLRHGEAVAIGMALDVLYAVRTGVLLASLGEQIIQIIRTLEFELFVPELEQRDASGRRTVLAGLDEFREHMGGRLTIPLIRAPGLRHDVHAMDVDVVDAAIDELRTRHG